MTSKTPLHRGIRYKPSSVLHRDGASIIYLRLQSLAASSNLPPDIGRATLNCRYTWSCNPRDVLTKEYCYPCGGLLPHLFTLTTLSDGGHSLLRYYTLTNIKPLTCVVLCVARTFLPHPKVAAIERICGANIALFFDNANRHSQATSSLLHGDAHRRGDMPTIFALLRTR